MAKRSRIRVLPALAPVAAPTSATAAEFRRVMLAIADRRGDIRVEYRPVTILRRPRPSGASPHVGARKAARSR